MLRKQIFHVPRIFYCFFNPMSQEAHMKTRQKQRGRALPEPKSFKWAVKKAGRAEPNMWSQWLHWEPDWEISLRKMAFSRKQNFKLKVKFSILFQKCVDSSFLWFSILVTLVWGETKKHRFRIVTFPVRRSSGSNEDQGCYHECQTETASRCSQLLLLRASGSPW